MMEDGTTDGDSTGPQGDPEGQDGPHPEDGHSWYDYDLGLHDCFDEFFDYCLDWDIETFEHSAFDSPLDCVYYYEDFYFMNQDYDLKPIIGGTCDAIQQAGELELLFGSDDMYKCHDDLWWACHAWSSD